MSSAASYKQSTTMYPMSEEASTSALSAAPVVLDESRCLASNAYCIGFYSESNGSTSETTDANLRGIHLNPACPSTALICGAQRSGKSTTLRRMLDSYFSDTNSYAELVVYWNDSGSDSIPTSEWLENAPTCTTFSRSQVQSPGARDTQGVHAIQISPSSLTEEMFIELCGVNETHPHYRDLMDLMYSGQDSEWSYMVFRERLRSQRSRYGWLISRCQSFDSFIPNECKTVMDLTMHIIPNSRTIIDLEGIPHRIAAVILKFIISQFAAINIPCTKVIALDGGEQLLSDKHASELLMPTMVKLARTTVHQNLSLIVSTQDPTAVPAEFLSACDLVVMHSMWSPSWMQYIAMHTAPVDHHLCAEVAKLWIGQTIVSCPRAVRLLVTSNDSRQVSPPIGWEHLRVHISNTRPVAQSGQAPTNAPNAVFAPLTPSSAGTHVAEIKDHHEAPAPPGLVKISAPSRRYKPGEARGATPIIPFNEDILDDVPNPRSASMSNIKHSHQPSGDDNWLGLAVQHYGSPSLSGQRSPYVRSLGDIDSSSDEVLVDFTSQREPEPKLEDKPPEETIIFARTRAISPPLSTLAHVNGETNEHPAGEPKCSSVSAHQVPLVRMLRSQRAEGRAKSTCSFIGTVLRKEKHSWMGKNWSLENYINKAALKGIITVVWNESGLDGWVTLSEFGRQVELPDAPLSSKPPISVKAAKYYGKRARFAPLRGLFQSEDGKLEYINGGIVGELRRSHPKLIPEGAGEVRKYIEEAIAAGVVEYALERKEWLKLVE